MAFTDTTYNERVIKEGIMPVRVTLTDTCDVGDLIGFDGVSSNVWERADADGKVPANLIAGEQGVSGDEIVCYKMALIDFGSDCSAADGDTVYLSNTPGAYSATAGGWINQCVGECVSTQVAFIHPSAMGLFSYVTTGTSWAAQIRAEVEADRSTEDLWGGMRIDFKAISTSTVSGDAYGLWIFSQLEVAPTSTSAFIRLENGNASSCQLEAYFMLIPGSVGPDYFMDLGGDGTPSGGCWINTGTCKTAADGWLKLRIAGIDTYINLHKE